MAVLGADEGPHLARLQGRVLHSDGPDGLLQQLEEAVVDGAFDQDTGPGAAVLAGVVEHAHGRGGRGLLDVRIREHDVGALAPEFQRHPLDLFGATRHHLLADLGRPREHDLAHVGVGDEPVADHRALPGQDGEDVLR